MTDTKWCRGCERNKPLDEFHNNKAAKDGKQSKCIECKAEWAQENRDKITGYKRAYRERHGDELKLKEREITLVAKYGLTLKKFDALLAAQGGVCALCGEAELGKSNWHVDHDHNCCPGKQSCGHCIRGILCPKCNKGLGMFNDDPALLTAATAYLMQNAATHSLNQS